MKKRLLVGFATGLFMFSVFSPAWATPFTATLSDNLGPLNGGALNYSVTSPGASSPGAATLTFDLLGYGSVDGANSGKDTFKLTVNGDLLFNGGFDMGGGPDVGGIGSSFINFIAPGVTILSTTSFGPFHGGLTQLSVAHTLLSGSNSYVFDYGVMEGLNNEGWGLRSPTITADINVSGSPVPEPATMLLFGAGIAGLAGTRIKRKRS